MKKFDKPEVNSSAKNLWWAGILVSVITLAPVAYSGSYFLRLMVLTFIYSILALSLSLLLNFTGIISLGQAAFFGIGAYVTGVLSTKIGLPFWVVLPIAAMAACVIAVLFGLLTFRSIKGLYFALASWALGEILCSIYMNVNYLGGNNGIRGIRSPSIFGFEILSDLSYYYFTICFVILSYASIELLLSSRIGRAWIAIKEDDIAAGVMGVNVYLFRVLALAIASFFAGIGGCLYAYYEAFICPTMFSVGESIIILCMVLIGGRGSLFGAIVGAAIFTFLPEALREFGSYRMVIYGLILLITILFRPKGLVPPFIVFGAKPSSNTVCLGGKD
jgi:branched-chain amino acid transport system permease protein